MYVYMYIWYVNMYSTYMYSMGSYVLRKQQALLW